MVRQLPSLVTKLYAVPIGRVKLVSQPVGCGRISTELMLDAPEPQLAHVCKELLLVTVKEHPTGYSGAQQRLGTMWQPVPCPEVVIVHFTVPWMKFKHVVVGPIQIPGHQLVLRQQRSQ